MWRRGGVDNIHKWAIHKIQLQWLTPYLNKSYAKLGHRNSTIFLKLCKIMLCVKSRSFSQLGPFFKYGKKLIMLEIQPYIQFYNYFNSMLTCIKISALLKHDSCTLHLLLLHCEFYIQIVYFKKWDVFHHS